MQESAKFWDQAAAKYAKSSIGDIEAYTYTLERTRSYLSPSDKVLEVGCGTGSTALLLAGNVDQFVASDVSRNMIEIAASKADAQGVANVEFITAELFDEAIESGPYDVVLALNVLHLLEDVPAAIRRINGLLKPGGKFVSKTACLTGKGMPFKFRLMMVVLPLMQMLGKAPFVKRLSADELERMIAEQGFEIIEISDRPPPSRYIVARKI